MSKRGRVVVAGLLTLAPLLACESGGGDMVILDVTPRVGATQGEQPVLIQGQNFRQDIGYTIYFGTKKTNSVTIRDPETIQVTTPTGMPEGPVDIMIRADDGNAFKIAAAYEFKNMGGSVVEGLGGPATGGAKEKGNLAY